MSVHLIALAAALQTSVTVFPSASSVPERLLRMSLRFTRPQSESIAAEIVLRHSDGTPINDPFAEPPLWSSDRRTLALLLDPSRQKRGLRNHKRLGFVLPAGQTVDVLVAGRSVKVWHVMPGGCPPLAPRRWQIRAVHWGTRAPLQVDFPAPVDGLAGDELAVAGADRRRRPGRGKLAAGETRWLFTPATPWRRGDVLAVHPRLEDPCGNEVGEPFEHRPGSGLYENRSTTFIPLPERARGTDVR